MTLLDSTLTLERSTITDTVGAVHDALAFLLAALQSPAQHSPAHVRRGALSLHRAAASLATLADQAEAAVLADAQAALCPAEPVAAQAPRAGVIDLDQARRRRHVRRTRPTLTGAPR